MIGALLLGLFCGVVARLLVPGDAFRKMSGPVSWLVSIALCGWRCARSKPNCRRGRRKQPHEGRVLVLGSLPRNIRKHLAGPHSAPEAA